MATTVAYGVSDEALYYNTWWLGHLAVAIAADVAANSDTVYD